MTRPHRRRGRAPAAILALLLALLPLAGVPAAAQAGSAPEPSAAQPQAAPPPLCTVAQRPAVRLEVFSNYQCSVCRQFYLEIVQRLQEDFADGELCVRFHDVPLQGYDRGDAASGLAAAAALLGPAVERRVVDALYRSQAQWSRDGDLGAVLAGVLTPGELARVEAAAASAAVEERLREDRRLAGERDVRGTPTIFVTTGDGERQQIPSTVQYPILRRYLRFLLAQEDAEER